MSSSLFKRRGIKRVVVWLCAIFIALPLLGLGISVLWFIVTGQVYQVEAGLEMLFPNLTFSDGERDCRAGEKEENWREDCLAGQQLHDPTGANRW